MYMYADSRMLHCSVTAQKVWSAKHHPQSVDEASDDVSEKELEKSSDEAQFGASLVIGALLVVPVVVICVTVTALRLRKKSSYFPRCLSICNILLFFS